MVLSLLMNIKNPSGNRRVFSLCPVSLAFGAAGVFSSAGLFQAGPAIDSREEPEDGERQMVGGGR